MLELCPYDDLQRIIEKYEFWDPSSYDDFFLYNQEPSGLLPSQLSEVKKFKIRYMDIEMEYWGTIHTY
jgi:hypothetical protein